MSKIKDDKVVPLEPAAADDNIIVENGMMEVIHPISPVTLTEYETSVDIPISREMMTAPLFSHGKKVNINEIRIFHLNPQKTRSIEITPKINDTINTEFEERVFIALIDIAKRQQEYLGLPQLPREIFATVSLIIKTMGLKYHGRYKERVKESLERLQHTKYTFNNSFFYSNDNAFKDEEHTSILSRYHYMSYIDVENNNPLIANFFGKDRRVKDFLIVEIAKSFYNNLVHKKGYLNFDSKQLLSIENGVARKIFMYCDRNRWFDDIPYKEKGNDLKIRISAQILSQIVPLSFLPKNVKETVKSLEKSFKYLKENHLISDFYFHQEKPLRLSWFEVFFEKSRKYGNDLEQLELVVHGQEIKTLSENNSNVIEDKTNSQWEELLSFYAEIYGSGENDHKFVDFECASKIKLLDCFNKDKFYGVLLTKYVVDRAEDVNSYLLGHGENNKYYVTQNAADSLRKKFENKKNKQAAKFQKEIEKKKEKEQDQINKSRIEHEFYKLPDAEKDKYLAYANKIFEKYINHQKIFKNSEQLAFSIYAISNGKYYNYTVESFCAKQLNINLSIYKTFD